MEKEEKDKMLVDLQKGLNETRSKVERKHLSGQFT